MKTPTGGDSRPQTDPTPLLDRSLHVFFKGAVRTALGSPRQALAFLKTVVYQRRATKRRRCWAEQGLHVPPMVIFSVTERCNLQCAGCYARALHASPDKELSTEEMHEVLREASELGIGFFMLAGGEPLVRRDLLDLTAAFPKMLFLLFTNGLLLQDGLLARLEAQRHVVPVLSLEGEGPDTDGRRGKGVFDRLRAVMGELKRRRLFFSVSLTLTRANVETVTDESFIGEMLAAGCKLFFLVEYSPVNGDTEDWVITSEQRQLVAERLAGYRARHPALFISVPGDEEQFGGCLSAGRGFIHLSAEGKVEPCPFVPYSDASLRDMSLREALQSEFLKRIRESEDLKETGGGCSLWSRAEWLQEMLASAGAGGEKA
jgi:MoaA/NifB/PqqE/SkfB family radical SAM enzyme